MRDQIEARRDQLGRELKQGQEMLAEMEGRRAELQQTLLRISGALQVLGELLGEEGGAAEPTVLTGPEAAGHAASAPAA